MTRNSHTTILKSIFIALCVCGVSFTGTEACDGYKLKINKFKDCNSNNMIKIENPRVNLTKECVIDADGCAELTNDFKSCKMIYDVKKKGMMVPFKGEKDVCEEIEKAGKDPANAATLKKYNLEPKCPVKKRKMCVPKDEKIDISKYKDKLRLAAGGYTGTLTFECDSGSSCFQFDMELKRGK